VRVPLVDTGHRAKFPKKAKSARQGELSMKGGISTRKIFAKFDLTRRPGVSSGYDRGSPPLPYLFSGNSP
jgi:hypothetical protein